MQNNFDYSFLYSFIGVYCERLCIVGESLGNENILRFQREKH